MEVFGTQQRHAATRGDSPLKNTLDNNLFQFLKGAAAFA